MEDFTPNDILPQFSSSVKKTDEQPTSGEVREDQGRFDHPSPDERPQAEETPVASPSEEPGPEKTIFTRTELVTGPLEPVNWLVEKLIPAQGVVVIGGDSGVGKSWLALHMAQSAAAGEPVLGRFKTSQGAVVYIDEESSPRLLKRRVQKVAAGLHTPDDIPITFFVNHQVRIDKQDSLEGLLTSLEAVKPKLVIFDSFIRIHGANENDSREMSEVHASLREIQTTLHCAIVLTHHSRKRSMFNQAGEMLRGSTDIRAFSDGLLFMRKTGETTRKVEHEKSRYDVPLEPFEIEIVDNEEETATYVRYIGRTEAPKGPKEIAKELIPDILEEEGPLPRQAIIDRCKGRAGSKAVGQALNELYEEVVVKREIGPRGEHIYTLIKTAEERLAAVFEG